MNELGLSESPGSKKKAVGISIEHDDSPDKFAKDKWDKVNIQV